MDAKLLDFLSQITAEERVILNGGMEIDRSLYMDLNDNVISAKKLLMAGKVITVRKHTRFIHFPKHRHDYVEMIYMVSGQTTHIINNETVSLHKGELLILNQHCIQETLPAKTEDIAFNFIILPSFFDTTLSMLGAEESALRKFLVGLLQDEKSETGYLHFHVADALCIQNLIENLLWTLSNDIANERSVNQFTMGLLFLHLLSHTEYMTHGNERESLTIKVLQYVDENYSEGSLCELAKLSNYDVYWLSKEIKKLTGSTYKELIQAKRLSQSKFLLETTAMNISDIAHTVGYSNLSYFHRLFLREVGYSPKQYREYTQN